VCGLIEHHSNIDPKKDTRYNQYCRRELGRAADRYYKCPALRKLVCGQKPRLAENYTDWHRSVIVLDEAQAYSVELLRPTLLALKELVLHYGAPSSCAPRRSRRWIWRAKEFEIGIEPVRPIVRDVAAIFSALKRVNVERLGKLSDEELLERLAGERAALCVVNTRQHAAKLYDALAARIAGDVCITSAHSCAPSTAGRSWQKSASD